ncbi:hypothetical protein DL239_10830 [Sedimentitalea sp. CY04]|uniref:Uncharacterized protein n=1 Tax=Parasedimentitalea denitrificans TaxID=2211118 RepID=A0ABX0WBA5_9RHOB|nr:hypothetical protein [Sedimentitalea sp. CY04]NIZ61471.1 hypothetical protein [Sedimentitalea sp. CY04]
MTVYFDYLSSLDVILTVYDGCSTNQQQLTLFRKISEEFGVGPFTNSVSDLSKLISTEMTATDMFSQSSMVKATLETASVPIKQALFAPTEMSYGISRMYMGFADLSPKLKIRIFDDLQAAVEWIGIPGQAETIFGDRDWHVVHD